MNSWFEGVCLVSGIIGILVLAMWPIARLDRKLKTVLGPTFVGLIVFAGYKGVEDRLWNHPDWLFSKWLNAAVKMLPAVLGLFVVYSGLRLLFRWRESRTGAEK